MKKIIFLLFLSFSSCGTDTGNPGADPSHGTDEGSRSATAYIVDTTCSKLVSCHSDLNFKECSAGVFGLSNLDLEFGLYEGEFASFADVNVAEKTGKILVNPTAAANCTSDIMALNCADENVQSAYQADAENPFILVERIYSARCEAVYIK